MISSLHGTVLHAGSDAVDVLVSGVGFTVTVTPDVARGAREGEHIDLHTTLIVREDSLSLFGFADRAQSELFGTLLGVTGVGPKSALGVVGALSIDDIARAVADGDDAPFRRVSGIGPKTAKLIVVQLAGKIAAPAPAGRRPPAHTSVQVVAALAGLGWSERVAGDAVDAVLAQHADAADGGVSAVLRLALAHLGPATEVARD